MLFVNPTDNGKMRTKTRRICTIRFPACKVESRPNKRLIKNVYIDDIDGEIIKKSKENIIKSEW